MITSPNFLWVRVRDLVVVVVDGAGTLWFAVRDDIIDRAADVGLTGCLELDDPLTESSEIGFEDKSRFSSKYDICE